MRGKRPSPRRSWRPPGSPSPAASRRARSSPPRASGPSCSTSVAAFVLKTRLRSRPLKTPRGHRAAPGLPSGPAPDGRPPPTLGCRGSPAAKTHVRYQEASPGVEKAGNAPPMSSPGPHTLPEPPRPGTRARALPPDPLFQTGRPAANREVTLVPFAGGLVSAAARLPRGRAARRHEPPVAAEDHGLVRPARRLVPAQGRDAGHGHELPR